MFEWKMSLLGGLLIGLSSSLLLWGIGRISGISGIMGTALTTAPSENKWRYAWILGLISGSLIYLKVNPSLLTMSLTSLQRSLPLAGLLIGFGTRLGSGCTYGHGVCRPPLGFPYAFIYQCDDIYGIRDDYRLFARVI